jgi:hypothetical protein
MNYGEIMTKPPFIYPHRVVVDDDGGGGEQIATAAEVTTPMVSAALASTPADRREQQVREIERHAAAAEARRQFAERRLEEDRQTPRQRLANLSKMQRVGVGLVALGLMLMVATTVALSRSGACRRPTSTPSSGPAMTTTNPAPTTASSATLSPRAQFIWDYIINNVTLVTGRTFLYPDDIETTAEGRALSWLIAEEELGERPISCELTWLRQPYVLATLWFQTPEHRDYSLVVRQGPFAFIGHMAPDI